MGKQRLASADGEGFLRAFTDSWADIEADKGVLIVMSVRPSGRRGVLEVTLSAWSEQEKRGHFPQASITITYPTAAVATFEASLFQATNKLDHILTQQRLFPSGKA